MGNPFEELKLAHEELLRAAGKMLDWLTAALEEWENLERWQLPSIMTRAQWLIYKAKEDALSH